MEEDIKQPNFKRRIKVFVSLGTIFLLIYISMYVYSLFVHNDYENRLGGYIANSVDTITPESFKEQLLLFKAAMIKEGLTEDKYGALIFKNQKNSMKFQYQHIESILDRADAMIQWQEASYETPTQTTYSPEAFRDVFNDKMNNLRNYINEGNIRSDWIAKDTWYLENHFILGVFGTCILCSTFLGGLLFYSLVFLNLYKYKRWDFI
jgi:hypothetical protein